MNKLITETIKEQVEGDDLAILSDCLTHVAYGEANHHQGYGVLEWLDSKAKKEVKALYREVRSICQALRR